MNGHQKNPLAFWWSIWVAVVFVFGCTQPTRATLCPEDNLIAPCKCVNYFNLIDCSGVTVADTDLRHMFRRLKEKLEQQSSKPIFGEFKLSQTSLEEVGADGDIFSGIAFRRITVSRNGKLKRLYPQTFGSSFNTTTELVIEDNVVLGAGEQDNEPLFELINQFTGLNTLHLTDNAVRFIPDNAFRRPQPALRELFMTDNRIERIGDNAFTGLNALELINLDGNQISVLSPKSLEIDNGTTTTGAHTATTPSLLKIFLRSNKLDADSFPPGIFSRLRRRSYLNLNINNITQVRQTTFQSFFHRRSVLSLLKNPLKCDCDFKWLLDQQVLYNSSDPKREYLFRDYQCVSAKDDEQHIVEVDHDDFDHCDQEPNHQATIQCLNDADHPEEEILCVNLSAKLVSRWDRILFSNLFVLILLYIFAQ